MDKDPTTSEDNPTNSDGAADTTTTTDPQSETGNQTGDDSQQPDPSKSTDDKTADGDNKPADDKSTGDNPTSPLDDDLDEWIEKRGLAAPTDDKQKQAYQDLRNSQREYTREQQSKKDAADLGSEVNKAKDENKPTGTDDDLEDEDDKRISKLEADTARERTTRLQSEFYTTNGVTNDEHKQIMEIIKEKIAVQPSVEGKQKAIDLWGDPGSLPDLLDIARARLAKGNDTNVADEAAQKERERIAKESNANSPGRSATSTPADKTAEETRTAALLERYKTPKK